MEDRAVPKDNNNKPSNPASVLLGNILVSGDDVLLQYELTKILLRFASKNEIMTHKLVGLLETTKHGLLTYTDMVCVSGEAEPHDEEPE